MSLQREKDGFKKLSMSTSNVVSDGLVGNLQGPKVFWIAEKHETMAPSFGLIRETILPFTLRNTKMALTLWS